MMKEVAIKYYPKDCTEIMHVSGPFFFTKRWKSISNKLAFPQENRKTFFLFGIIYFLVSCSFFSFYLPSRLGAR